MHMNHAKLPLKWQITFKTLRLLGQLPLPVLRAVGNGLGMLTYWLARKRRHIAEVNLRLCFPEKTDAERRAILRSCFRHLGQGLAEVPFAWYAPADKLKKYAKIDGLSFIEASRSDGYGVILLTFHFTGIELGGQMLAQHIPDVHALYRVHKNPFFESEQRARRARFATPVPRDEVRKMLKALRNGKVLWFLPDQDHGRSQSVFVDFFGQPAATITSTTWFTKHAKVRVHPVIIHRTQDGMTIKIQPALENFPGRSPQEDAQRLMNLLEQTLQQNPEDYMWVHRRFKTRPEGFPSVY